MNKYRQFKITVVKTNELCRMLFSLLLIFFIGIAPSYSKNETKISNGLQQIKEKRITIQATNKPLNEILLMIQDQTNIGYGFANNIDAKTVGLFSIDAKNEVVENALNALFKGTKYTFSVLGNNIVVNLRTNNPPAPQVTTQSNSKVEIKGKVLNFETKKPVVGATIIVTGTSDGAISDEKGEFRFFGTPGMDLECSFLGMISVTVKVKKLDNNFVLELKPDAIAVEDVVVTGIFTRKAESFTGSAVTLSAKDLQRVGNQNLFQSLKNLDPSLMNIENMEFGSDPNRMPELQMRGTSSFPTDARAELKGNYQNKPNQPLFILDGFPVSSETVFDMDMNRVQSLTILKDASAKAIYGSKAANGVIVIETKTTGSESVIVNYSGSLDVTAPDLTSYNMANAAEKLAIEVQDGFYTTDYMPDVMKKQNIYAQRHRDVMEGLDTYWLAKPLQMGIGTKHSISAELGSDQVRVMGTFGYHNVKGVMKESSRDNISGSLSVTYRNQKVSIKNSMSINSNHSEDSPYGSFADYAAMNPYHRATDKDGNVSRYAEVAKMGGYSFYDKFTNPLYNATINTSLTNSYLEFINNFYAEWNIISGLKLTARFGITAKNNKADQFYPGDHTMFESYSGEDKYRRGKYTLNDGSMSDLNGDVYLNYSKSFGKNYFFLNVGGNMSDKNYLETIFETEGFPSDRMNNILFARQYAKDSKPDGSESTVRDIGALAVMSYTYDDRFLFDATVRESASSQFGSNNRWGTFWSTGIGWNLHKEKFLSQVKDLSLLKVRASVGTTGNQSFESYKSMATYKYYLDKTYNGFLGTYLQAMANPDLGWERKMDYNVGFDMKYKFVSLKLDYYLSYTENLLTDISIPSSNGFSSVVDNLGNVRNNGFDGTITVTPIQNKNGFLNLNFMISTNNNKIIKISDALRVYNDKQRAAAANTQQNMPLPMYEEGMSLNSIWAVQSLGIDPATGNEIFLKRNGEQTTIWDSNDMINAGTKMSKYTGNFGLNGEYKGFGVSVVFRFLGGGQMYNTTLVNKIENIDIRNNVDKRVLSSRWTKPGDIKQFKRLGEDRTMPMVNGKFPEEKTRSTTRFVQDRNELDFSSLNVYYDFNRELIRKIGVDRLKIGFYMNDIYKWSSMGVERGTSYPFARTMSIQLSATF